MNIATEFICYNLRFRLRIFTVVAGRVERELFYKRINNVVFPDTGSNLLPDDYKSNTKPLSYRTNDENYRSNSVLTFKCGLLFQMIEQSYSSLFTLTNGFNPMSIKRLLCDFDYVSSENFAQVISAVQGLFLKLFKTT